MRRVDRAPVELGFFKRICLGCLKDLKMETVQMIYTLRLLRVARKLLFVYLFLFCIFLKPLLYQPL